jgi:hypothetical protein
MLNNVVYLLWHTDTHKDEKLTGVYRTEGNALAAIERTMEKPGFSDDGEGLSYSKRAILREALLGIHMDYVAAARQPEEVQE